MIRTELTFRLPNSPGALAGVCRLLADEHVNVLALALDATGHLRLVVDNPVRAGGVLESRHHRVSQRDVIFLPLSNVPGAAAPALELLAAAGINVDYVYSGAGDTGLNASVVIGVEDAVRASAVAGL